GNTRSHLFLLDLDSGAISQLTHGLADEIQPAWSPDGASIAFLTKAGPEPDAHDNWDLYLIDARPGSTARQLTDTPEMENDPVWGRGYGPPRFSPDGRQLAYVRGGDPKDSWFGLVQLAFSGFDGSAAQLPTTSLDRLTLDPHWSRDGRWVYFLLEDDRSQLLARLRLKDGHIERLTHADSVVSEFDVASDGGVIAVYGTSNQPGELAAIEHGRIRPLTHHNDGWAREVSLVPAKNIEFTSADGTSVHALLLLPAGEKPEKGWPTLVSVDGGPVAQWQHEFDFEWQYFVQQGYAVVAANPRGSSGRGFAYQRAIFANWGFVDGPDVLAAADFAVRAGYADPRRLGIGGWSYGSQLTNFIIATDRRFKAATSGAGISNMLSGYGVDQYVREWEAELGLPWQNTALWLKMSYAFLHADQITTPTLFMCGSEDANVPAIGAQQMYQALRRLGVATELVIYPGEYHSFARPGFRIDVIRRYVEWYDRYLKAN
ncbi:MAG: S9 family peptidase, partial [Steroidobacterales bacterium]